MGTEDAAIWDALNLPRDFNLDRATRQALLEVLKGTETITDVGEGEIVSVDETRADGRAQLAVGRRWLSDARRIAKFPQFPTLYHQGAGGEHQVALTFR